MPVSLLGGAMINRSALILKYKQPAVDWINTADPYESLKLTLEAVNNDLNVYLISDEDSDNAETLQKWLALNLEALFFDELNGWYTDQSLWPKNRNMSLFNEWFTVECHTVLHDTVGEPFVDDGI